MDGDELRADGHAALDLFAEYGFEGLHVAGGRRGETEKQIGDVLIVADKLDCALCAKRRRARKNKN